MSTKTLDKIKCIGAKGGNPPIINAQYKEANSQSFKEGDIIKFSSGVLAIGASDDTGIAGVSGRDATNVTTGNKVIPFYVANDLNIFEGNIYHSTAASAVMSVLAEGTLYALAKVGNNFHIDLEDTGTATKNICKIIQKSPKDEWGDIYMRVYFQIIDSGRQLF